jgi:hypothetical protein
MLRIILGGGFQGLSSQSTAAVAADSVDDRFVDSDITNRDNDSRAGS